jgi:hypothetical protein
VIAALLVVAVVCAVFFFTRTHESPPPTAHTVPATFAVSVRPTPADAIIEIDGQPVARGSFRGAFPVDGRAHTLRVSKDGYVAFSSVFRDVPPEAEVTLDPVAVPPPVAPASIPEEPETPTAPSAMRVRERPEMQEAPAMSSGLDIRFER